MKRSDRTSEWVMVLDYRVREGLIRKVPLSSHSRRLTEGASLRKYTLGRAQVRQSLWGWKRTWHVLRIRTKMGVAGAAWAKGVKWEQGRCFPSPGTSSSYQVTSTVPPAQPSIRAKSGPSHKEVCFVLLFPGR